MMFVVWPIAIWLMKDRPGDIGEQPDGEPAAGAFLETQEPKSFSYILRQPAFWLLLVGSFTSIGAIGSINQHMKLIFLDAFKQAGLGGPRSQTLLNDMFSTSLFWIGLVSNIGRILMGYLADRLSKKWVMVATYFLAAGSIPLLFQLKPPSIPWLFTFVFGMAMGADYMLIPLAAAEQFGLASLARTMAILLPADTVGQACVPYLVSQIRQGSSDYGTALGVVFAMALVGAVAIVLLPCRYPKRDRRLIMRTMARQP
jgi:MFS family permease